LNNTFELQIPEALKTRISEIKAIQGSPFYLYDCAAIREHCLQFTALPYEPKAIHFALMANSNPQFIRILKDCGLKVFVNSIPHLEQVLSLGFKGEEIVFAASAMDEAKMKQAEGAGCLVVLDSVGQLELWSRLFPLQGACLRCNIGDQVSPKQTLGGYFIGKDSRLGFTREELQQLKGDPRIRGLHSYVGTNILQLSYFMDCYRKLSELAEWFPNLQVLDFGGGFGLSEDPSQQLDLQDYGAQVSALMRQLSLKLGAQIRLILEPGRIIGAEAGYFVCEVVDLKTRGKHQLIGVNASCAQFPRPLFYPDEAFHPVAILAQNEAEANEEKILSSIYGCSTYSRDFLARDILLPPVKPGDTVILGYAGSYCASSYTHFLGFAPAREFFT